MAKLKSSKTRSKQAPKAGVAEGLKSQAEGLSRSIMESAQHIWLAGVGAFGRAQEEGTKLFENLVKEGMSLERKTRNIATGRVDAVRDAVENRVGQVRERASDTWDRLEKVFEERVQRAMNRLGVPGREEIQALSSRVDELNRELRKLGGAKPAAAKPAAKKAAAKPAAKKAKPAARKAAKPAAKKAKAAAKPASEG
jgi:poly(hydroxyalkanoate) granule-associated protein